MKYSPLCHALTWAMVLLNIVVPLVASQSLPNLRIMPLGDSITKGNGASDGNGYRKRLRQKLLNYDSTVDMIGTQKSPKMPVDGDHQGHSGKYLAQIREFLQLSIAAQPNIVLVHAGTNNMDKQVDLAIATDLIEGIMNDIWEGSPKAVVLVMPVIWANDPGMQQRTDKFNAQLGTIIKRKQGAGQHVLSVPTQITAGDLSDRKHPNDQGYEKMATAWFKGILEAHERGWISKPTEVDASKLPSNIGLGSDSNSGGGGGVVDGSCGTGNWEAQGKVFDGISVWEEVGLIMTGPAGASRDKVILADLNNDGLADYILAYDGGAVAAWINGGKPNQWTSLGSINPAWKDVRGDMIRMADVDGDGKADMIALYKDGKAKVWKNVDDGKKFEALDAEWADRDESRDIIHFQDINGDGYADYVLVYSGGAVKWAQNSKNNGKDSGRANWEGMETIAPGPAGMPANRASIQDIDGDGLAGTLILSQKLTCSYTNVAQITLSYMKEVLFEHGPTLGS
jgi:lysophospholipase L1-like esterase